MNPDSKDVSRRSFVRTASLGLGAGVALPAGAQVAAASNAREGRPPRKVWVASICQDKLESANIKEMTRKLLGRMEETLPMQPDIICLPEVCHASNLTEARPPLAETAEEPIGHISRPFADFARANRCHVICPIFTTEAGRYYNAAVVIDREGQYVGQYRKINPTDGELKNGLTPGPLDPPVFKLDFGTIGIQICFDINWHDNWRRLAGKGAEIVFWPSAFAGGEMLNGLAWMNKYYIVSSTRIQASKIVDPLGCDMVSTGRFGRWLCAPINLDVAVIQGWQDINKLEKVRKKYGRMVNVRIKHTEAWAALECISPDISVPEILKEFNIETSREMLARNTRLQDAQRPET